MNNGASLNLFTRQISDIINLNHDKEYDMFTEENISNVSTKELVAEYNRLSGKSIKKFSSRKAGEKQVLALQGAKPATSKKEAKAKPATAKKEAKVKEPADRSSAIAATWKDDEVRAARAQRTHVRCGGTEYRSVKQAFEALNLPLSKHITFRMQLKASGRANFNNDGKSYTFTIAE